VAFDHNQLLNPDDRAMPAVDNVEVRRVVIGIIHGDEDAEKPV
jgi:hypothetical protein